MSTTILVFLGIIAFCSLIQAVFFAALAVASWKGAAKVDDLAARANADMARMAEKVETLTAKLETLSRQARETVQRTEPVVTSVTQKAERLSGTMRHSMETPFVPLRKGAAFVHGVVRALESYRDARKPASSR